MQINPIPTPGSPAPQPQPPLQPAPQPTQPAPIYSSEPKMHTNAGDEQLMQVTVILDSEALQIINNASAVHGESIVNLGIKLFAKTNIYKEFMMKPGTIPLDTNTEDIVSLTEAAASMADKDPISRADIAKASTPAPAQAGGFQTW